MLYRFPLILCVIASTTSSCFSALVLNPAQPITQELCVSVVQISDTDGSNSAPLFGTPAEQTAIFDFVDDIWAQAGIDVEFQSTIKTFNDTTSNFGTMSPRPATADLNAIRTAVGNAGLLEPNCLDLFMVNIVPGFAQTGDNTVNGLAYVPGDGIAMWIGPDLPDSTGGQEVAASVLAHEIGHNLGLFHTPTAPPADVIPFNLMQEGGSPDQGEELNSAQISTALSTGMSLGVFTPVPEPSAFLFLALACAAVGGSSPKFKRLFRRLCG